MTTESSIVVKQFDLSGHPLAGGFALNGPASPLFLTVVTAAEVTPGSAVPEPSSAVLVAIGLGVGGLGAARRWRALPVRHS